jgi:hypothetical protein
MIQTQAQIDKRFMDRVEELVGRELTADEKTMAFSARDVGRYDAEACAIEILVCEPK